MQASTLTLVQVEPRLDDPLYPDTLAFRRRLLRHPLNLDFTAAEISAEPRCIHLALRDEAGTIAGTLLLVPPDAHGTAKLRQMAIEPALQRQGLGAKLVGAGEAELIRRHAVTITLAARAPAIPFYGKLGYKPVGEPYIDLTIPHLRMDKHHPKA